MTALDVDPYLPNAYSKTLNKDGSPEGCRFDLTSYQAHLDSQEEPGKKLVTPEIVADELLLKKNERNGWELDVRGLMSTKKWLNNYGLKKNKLDIQSLMQAIGFKKKDDYDYTLLKPIPSKYTVGKGFVEKYTTNDGRITNVSVSKERVKQIASRLKQALQLFKLRMAWLTSESRRIFGVIQESVVIIVLDAKTLSPQQFDQYRCAAERVLKEQVSTVAKFNIYRATDEMQMYRDECVAVSQRAIDEAVDWLWTLERTRPVGQTSCCEAVCKALEDKQAQGVYLFTMGNSAESALELLLANCQQARKPLNVVSYNCTTPEVMKSLKSLSDLTKGRFHAYGVIMEMESFDPLPLEDDSNRAHVAVRRRTIGGVPAGAGVRPDVLRLFEEIEEAQSSLAQIETILSKMPESKKMPFKKNHLSQNNMSRHLDRAEEYMGSSDWLNVNGLKVKRLTFHDLLGKVAFRHCDGVVNLKKAPAQESYKTDADSKNILVNARYCDQFAHVKWKDGTLVHVQITPETHRVYEEKVVGLLEKISNRVKWLNQGSRELFGTIIERRLYLVIDTSGSMAPSLQFVKDKIFLLLQEQIRHKDAFNIISFGSKVTPWRDRLVEVSEENLKQAWTWIKNLETDGSTNTLGALKYALADHNTEGIYLLTDGRPDHPPKSVLAQVTLQEAVPIHTISFNCADAEANKFLCQLAKDTRGRYHYFSEHGEDVEGPNAYQSEDIRLLEEERQQGLHYLSKVAALRDECQELQWKRSANAKWPAVRNSATGIQRPQSAMSSLRYSMNSSGLLERPESSRPGLPVSHSAPVLHTSCYSPRTSTYVRLGSRGNRKPKVAAHTKTSLLRSLSASNDWVLPETKAMLTRQFKSPRERLSPPIDTPREVRVSSPSTKAKKSKPKFLASKAWLQKHGLKAKKLLLLDALQEAVQKDRTSSLLGMESLSRLIDEKLSSERSPKLEELLSNPYLEESLLEYERRLVEALNQYKSRLDRIVWESLPLYERDKYRDEEEASAEVELKSFYDNKEELMKSLDSTGWPVSQRSVTLLEEEIKQAQAFLAKSSEIREASEGCEKREKNKPQTQKVAVEKPKKRMSYTDQLKGQRVVARDEKDGFYYTGLVVRSKGAHHALVRFDSGEEQVIPKQYVIPSKGAIAVPKLQIGDYALAMVRGPGDVPCYLPARVVTTPQQSQQENGKFYEVALYNRTQVSVRRGSIVKLGKARYNLSVAYIMERNERPVVRGDSDDDAESEDSRNPGLSSKVKKLCYKILSQQKKYQSEQKRLHSQMQKMREEYKELNKGKDTAGTKRQSRFRSLDSVEEGEEVLARWTDDGWYYRCLVQRRISDRTYMLQDSCGDLQQTSRDDIITDKDDDSPDINLHSHVIACHPNYNCSYAPAIVDDMVDPSSPFVTFYDGTTSVVERHDVFAISQETYDRDVAFICRREEELVGQAVIARDNKTGNYALGTIISKAGCRRYNIELADGREVEQSAIHIFGAFSRQYKFSPGDHCLSVCDDKLLTYLPGVVTGKSRTGLNITFVDGSKQTNVHSLKSFWLSQDYYEAAETYYNNRSGSSTATSVRSDSPSSESARSRSPFSP